MKIELDPSAASPKRRRSAKRSDEPAPTVRSGRDQTSPRRAAPTPPWRSKFLVALVGIGLTAAAFYWAIPAGHGRPTSVTVFGVNAPDAPVASYPGLRLPPQSQLASAEALR